MKPAAPTAGATAPRPSLGGMLPFVIIAVVLGAFVIMGPGQAWDTLFINPLINALLLLTNVLAGNFGLAIIVFTLALRLATLPLTVRQFRATRAMQEMQPRVQELQKKYKDPKRRQEEMMKVYREVGFNPLGCAMPMAIQMLVFIALYRALAFVVGGSPESLVGLSQKVYPWDYLTQSVPLEQSFLWLELGKADTTLILPLMVFVSTYVQTKLSQTPSTTPQQQQQQQMMTWMMPFFLTFIMLQLPSGVGVYWVISNVFSVFVSYIVYGRRFSWRALLPISTPATPEKRHPKQQPEPRSEEEQQAQPVPRAQEARSGHGKRRGKRKKRR